MNVLTRRVAAAALTAALGSAAGCHRAEPDKSGNTIVGNENTASVPSGGSRSNESNRNAGALAGTNASSGTSAPEGGGNNETRGTGAQDSGTAGRP